MEKVRLLKSSLQIPCRMDDFKNEGWMKFLDPIPSRRVFVQTRDRYGNFLTSDSENVTFESCIELGLGCDEDADTCT
jgi:hypothetical protein